jgi:hypothetical protein
MANKNLSKNILGVMIVLIVIISIFVGISLYGNPLTGNVIADGNDIHLSLNGTYPSSENITINGSQYTIGLITGSGTTSATIGVKDTSGNYYSKQIIAGSSKSILGLDVTLNSVLESPALGTIDAVLSVKKSSGNNPVIMDSNKNIIVNDIYLQSLNSSASTYINNLEEKVSPTYEWTSWEISTPNANCSCDPFLVEKPICYTCITSFYGEDIVFIEGYFSAFNSRIIESQESISTNISTTTITGKVSLSQSPGSSSPVYATGGYTLSPSGGGGLYVSYYSGNGLSVDTKGGAVPIHTLVAFFSTDDGLLNAAAKINLDTNSHSQYNSGFTILDPANPSDQNAMNTALHGLSLSNTLALIGPAVSQALAEANANFIIAFNAAAQQGAAEQATAEGLLGGGSSPGVVVGGGATSDVPTGEDMTVVAYSGGIFG